MGIRNQNRKDKSDETQDNNFVLQSQKEYEAVKSNENWTKSEKDFKRLIS